MTKTNPDLAAVARALCFAAQESCNCETVAECNNGVGYHRTARRALLADPVRRDVLIYLARIEHYFRAKGDKKEIETVARLRDRAAAQVAE